MIQTKTYNISISLWHKRYTRQWISVRWCTTLKLKTSKQTHENRLRVFEMSCSKRIAWVTSRDRIRNKEVSDRVGLLQDAANRSSKCSNLVMWKEWIILDIQNWHSTDMCMRQEDEEDPRKDGRTWWRMTISNVTSTFIRQHRWLSIVQRGGAWWSWLCK